MSPPTARLPPDPPLPLLWVADLHDSLMIAAHDLARLQRLLSDAAETLMGHYFGATRSLQALVDEDSPRTPSYGRHLQASLQHLNQPIAALQFEDMADQLIAHVQRRLRHDIDHLACAAMGDDDGIVAEAPTRSNPVTQGEVEPGLVELF